LDQVNKWEAKINRKSRALAERAREAWELIRAKEQRLREAKDRLIAETWKEKGERWLANEEKRNKYEAMDETRDMINDEKDKRRARIEKARWDEARRQDKEVQEEKDERRKVIHLEALRKAKVEAMHRATAKREQARREALREKQIHQLTDARVRKFRERQYLEQAKAALEPHFDGGEKEEGEEDKPADDPLEDTMTRAQKQEQAEFQKTFEFQQRADRRASRAVQIKKEEAKRAKLDQLGAKDPKGREIARIAMWRQEEEENKERLEKAKLDKELKFEEAQKLKIQADIKRVETFEKLEKTRRERSREREERRNEGARARIRNAAVGSAMTLCLSY